MLGGRGGRGKGGGRGGRGKGGGRGGEGRRRKRRKRERRRKRRKREKEGRSWGEATGSGYMYCAVKGDSQYTS